MAKADDAEKEAFLGGVLAFLAYGSWGVVPIYWKLFANLPAALVTAHRAVWAFLFLGVVLVAQRRGQLILAVFKNKKLRTTLALTSLLLLSNWSVWMFAVQTNRLLEASLGYFINPLMNVALGVAFLKERLNWPQRIAVGCAAIGVLQLAVALGSAPWIALSLASCFALYGLIKKIRPVDSLVGLFVEMSIALPLSLVVFGVYAAMGAGAFNGQDGLHILLLTASGVITALPLIWFAGAARRLRLSTLGLVQYIGPTGQFLLAVFVYDEPMSRPHVVAFGMIWCALALYTISTGLASQSAGRPNQEA